MKIGPRGGCTFYFFIPILFSIVLVVMVLMDRTH